MTFHVPERFRDDGDKGDNNGWFFVPTYGNWYAITLASDGLGWEHVSAHMFNGKQRRCPNWDEMCKLKSLFWDEEDCVVQYHPPKSEYVNNHDTTLHLWRPVGTDIPRPPSILVGVKKDEQ